MAYIAEDFSSQSANRDEIHISGRDMGGAKRMGGGKRTRERTLPDFLDPSKRASGLLCRAFLHRKNRALTPERGVENVPYGGQSKTPFWEGCHP